MKLAIGLSAALVCTVIIFTKAFAPSTEQYLSQDSLSESIERGAAIYMDYCIQCHLGKGEGVKGTFPPLAGSDWLSPERYTEAIKVVKYGQQGKIKVNGVLYNGVMANLGLYDDEVADVMNYIMNTWGNVQKEMITKEKVTEIKE